MNRINPDKLLLLKWTAVKPRQKECHFMVTKLIRAENDEIIACELEALINKKLKFPSFKTKPITLAMRYRDLM